MTQNNNLSVLPFYTRIDEQNHRRSYAYGKIYPLYVPLNKLIPFQFMKETSANPITSISVYDKNGVFVKGILSEMNEGGLKIVRFESDGYDIVVYPALMPLNLGLYEGQYYLKISDSYNDWYSEVFTLVLDMSTYLKIEWYDLVDCVFDAGRIIYRNPLFKNNLYLATELGKPDYEFEEEGEDRDGYFFPEKQISEKTYKFTFLAPEFLCDVMRLIRLSDIINITDKFNRSYKPDTFLITPKWEVQGDTASIEAEFQTNTVVKKIGRLYQNLDSGDFNDDFNNDFNN